MLRCSSFYSPLSSLALYTRFFARQLVLDLFYNLGKTVFLWGKAECRDLPKMLHLRFLHKLMLSLGTKCTWFAFVCIVKCSRRGIYYQGNAR